MPPHKMLIADAVLPYLKRNAEDYGLEASCPRYLIFGHLSATIYCATAGTHFELDRTVNVRPVPVITAIDGVPCVD